MSVFKSDADREHFLFWGTLLGSVILTLVAALAMGRDMALAALAFHFIGMVGLAAACWVTSGEDDE